MNVMLQIDSLALAKNLGYVGVAQGVSSVWILIAIIEGILILCGFVIYRYKKTVRYQLKTEVLQEDMDLSNIFNSAFNAEPIYKELSRVCHPDRFAPDEAKMQVADELFQRVAKSRNNIKELLNLKQEVREKLKINL